MENVTYSNEETATIQTDISEKLNFASYQNSYALLHELRIENSDTQAQLEDVQVTLTADPAFLKPRQWQIDRVAPGGSLSVQNRDIELDGGFFLNLADVMRGAVTVRMERNGEVLAEETRPVELLSYNEWGGSGYMPELLAAFSLPNDPAVDRILHDASRVLRRAGKPDGIDGYQSGKRERVWEIASAIYTAIANLGITYAEPPASFERDGQKIRLPGQILEGRAATCLDITMLFAAVLEQAGLNTVVALPQGHAMVGVWLQPEELSSIVIDDAEILRKRYQLNEIILVETTLATTSPAPSFSKAIEVAADKVAADFDDSFRAVVDISQARSHRITPLGLKLGQAGSCPDEERSVEMALESAPTLPGFDDEAEEGVPETPVGRLERWQRKLLDLSARNPLLNHKSTKTSLRLLCPDCGKLEDKLADGARIAIQGIPQATTREQDEDIHKQRTGESITDEYARESLERNQVLVDLPPEEIQKRAVNIYRQAQTSLQEGGANTLYLALGFLRWKRDDNDDRRFRAPLILLPVNLERKSVRSGVKILAHDDEPRFNTTLLEMLRKDFRISIPELESSLPTDESGIDVNGIWQKIQVAIKEVPGFEVVEDVVLGHFSFAKYLMWKDLSERTDTLRQNPVVRHLIDSPREQFPSDTTFVWANEIDADFKPADFLTPLPADGSQMATIATADRGKDFVVIGPPGTGKSQTISNLIAHTLGKGKTVLFVSEKTAALEVVYRRLEQLGLGRFCLQLHSNKARKADVLKQLGGAWDMSRRMNSDGWQSEADRLCQLRDRLNVLVDHLHRRHSNGLTPHYAIGVKVRDEMLACRIELSWPQTDQHSEQDLAAMREVVANMQVQAIAIGAITDSPFQLIEHDDWTPQWESQVAGQASKLADAAAAVKKASDTFCRAIEINLPDETIRRQGALAELAQVLLDSYRRQAAFALEPDGLDHIEALESAVTRLKAYADAQSSLSCAYEPMAWRTLDGNDIARRWQAAADTWWPKRFFMRRSVIKAMRNGGAKGKPDPVEDASMLTRLREDGEAIDSLDKQLSAFKDWQAHTTEPDKAQALQELGHRVRGAVGKLADGPQASAELRGKIRTLLYDCNDLLAPEAAVGRTATDYLNALEYFQTACAGFEGNGARSVRGAFAESECIFEAVRQSVDMIVERRAELHGWCAWRKRRVEALDVGLAPLVHGIEQGDVPIDEIPETFEAAYCAWWSERVINDDEVLRVSTPEHTAAIKKFRAVDEAFQQTTADYIRARLRGQVPSQEDTKHGSQWGILQRKLQKKARHKPVRQLVQEIPDVLTTLAPCLMMSPLSIAQYLPAEQSLFDVVIFDEASQITVWDAVGSLARGRQIIVVGDPKQMPPTNFFNRSDDDPDGDVEYEGDLESILDEMVGANIPQLTMNLHYRSRRESLIAFSNARYYNNELITFPAAVTHDRGIRLVRPEGHYARGQAQHNQGEAEAIVKEIVRRLTSAVSEERERSIGVVTFNSKQQTLIEDLLDKARHSNPNIEWAFADDRKEPVFVKNLETVQGDERDVILFSITYGPDQTGHVTMNFGPLNREGGERRLNVAMTRARSEMIVFSTLHPDRIDLSRTSSRAVADLKHFLEYAERGPAALGEAVHGSLGDFESPFETAVARALSDKGWEVHPQIGVSAYRVDLGIVHPDVPGVYVAGVECDGAMYHSSAVAKERDKIRQSVLEGLGWTLFRVWSTDWWINKAEQIAELDSWLRGHLDDDREKWANAAEVIVPEEQIITHDESMGDLQLDLGYAKDDQVDSPAAWSSANDVGKPASQEAGEQQVVAKSPVAAETNSAGPVHHYVFASLDQSAGLVPKPEHFYDEGYETQIMAMIDHVIDMEGPIHQDVLVRRIARHHGFQRAGRQIRDLVLGLARNRRGHTREDVGLFFWPKGTVKGRLAPARFQNRDDELRKLEYICSEELQTIDQALEANGDSIVIAHALGIRRLSQSARQRIETALTNTDSI